MKITTEVKLKEILSGEIIPTYSHHSNRLDGSIWLISPQKEYLVEMGNHRRLSALWGERLYEINPRPQMFDSIDEYPEGYVLSMGWTYVGWIPKA